MRILFLSHYARPYVGGIETVVDMLGRELRALGHDVTHLASAGHRLGEPPESDAVRVIRVPAINYLDRRFGMPYPIFSPSVVTLARREVARADVVHAHGFLYMSSFAGLLLARRLGRGGPARVLTEHVGYVPYEFRAMDAAQRLAITTVGRGCVRAAQVIVVLNDRVRAELAPMCNGSPLLKISNGVDTEAYRPPMPGERAVLRRRLGWDERPRVLVAGRLVAKKRIELAIDAARIGDGAFRVVLVGPGRPDLADAPGVDFLGAMSRDELAELYRAADALLTTAVREGFPMVVQEAMASGLPVVVTDETMHREYLTGAGAAARLSDPDGAVIAAALMDATASDAVVRAAAASFARARFSGAQMARRYEELYVKLTERGVRVKA